MAAGATVASQAVHRPAFEQEPPAYIIQSWQHKQANLHDQYLVQQTFMVAPDTFVPASRLRQHIRNIYEERARATIVVHYDPWTTEAVKALRTKTASASASTSSSTKDLPVNVDVVRSHTIL